VTDVEIDVDKKTTRKEGPILWKKYIEEENTESASESTWELQDPVSRQLKLKGNIEY